MFQAVGKIHRKALLVHSCTAALEMAAMLTGVGAGDEVICPSFTFVTTASAFARCGAKIVFCDIRKDTLNIDENQIESLITDRTKGIVPVHYAGVSAEMDRINNIAKKHRFNAPKTEPRQLVIQPCKIIKRAG